MQKLAPYTKAIVPLVAGAVAVVFAIFRGDAPSVIPGDTELLQGILTSLFVYAVRNTPPE